MSLEMDFFAFKYSYLLTAKLIATADIQEAVIRTHLPKQTLEFLLTLSNAEILHIANNPKLTFKLSIPNKLFPLVLSRASSQLDNFLLFNHLIKNNKEDLNPKLKT